MAACHSLHSNEAFALVGLGLAGVVAEQVAALAPVAGQEVQLAPASQEGCCIHIQIVVVLQQHKYCHSKATGSVCSIAKALNAAPCSCGTHCASSHAQVLLPCSLYEIGKVRALITMPVMCKNGRFPAVHTLDNSFSCRQR